MRTPAGKECSYFYGDYFRGRNKEECRLIDQGNGPVLWTPDLCKSCPVPDILAANACPNLILSAEVAKQFGFLGKKVKVSSYCTKTNSNVNEPKVGCGQCHPLPPVFTLTDDRK
jgi:hypothetical protein